MTDLHTSVLSNRLGLGSLPDVIASQLIVRLETRAPADKWSLIDLQVRVKITSGNAKQPPPFF